MDDFFSSIATAAGSALGNLDFITQVGLKISDLDRLFNLDRCIAVDGRKLLLGGARAQTARRSKGLLPSESRWRQGNRRVFLLCRVNLLLGCCRVSVGLLSSLLSLFLLLLLFGLVGSRHRIWCNQCSCRCWS